MKRVLAVLIVSLVALLAWMASQESADENAASKTEPASIAVERAMSELDALEPVSTAPEPAPATASAERVEIAPRAAPEPVRLTLLGSVRDRRGRAIENFGIRGIRKNANNVFVEERVWEVAFHAGGEFALEDLEPHAWELAPFADGYTLERNQRFVRSNARPIVFRMKAEVEVAGIVLDARDQPVAGASVRATEQSDARAIGDGAVAVMETTTDGAGRFRMSLDAAAYSLRASSEGYVDSQEQVIEFELDRPRRDLELRLVDGCGMRLVFDRKALGVRAPTGVMAAPLLGGRGPRPTTVDANASEVTLRGFEPGWHRLVIVSSSPPDTIYAAAVELTPGPPLEVNFELRSDDPVTLAVRPLQPPVEPTDFRLHYEFLPTLPDLHWLAITRDSLKDGASLSDQRWRSADEWNAPGPGSYVVFPKRRSHDRIAPPKRLEAPRMAVFELLLPPLN